MRRSLAFLTAFGGAAVPDTATMSWFPLAGAAIGAAVGGTWWAAGQVWPPLLAASVAVAFDLAVTGMLHMDGLADTADGLLPHAGRTRRLEIMRDPTIGAYGAAVLTTVIIVRVGALAAMVPNAALLAGVWAASRTAMAVGARALPYARTDGGLATAMIGGSPYVVAAYGSLGAVTLAVVARGSLGAAAVVVGLASAAAVVGLGHRRLGGFTGDVLGAAGVVGETAALLVAAVR